MFGALDAMTRSGCRTNWSRSGRAPGWLGSLSPIRSRKRSSLADRVVVMSPGPGRIDDEYAIDLCPGRATSPAPGSTSGGGCWRQGCTAITAAQARDEKLDESTSLRARSTSPACGEVDALERARRCLPPCPSSRPARFAETPHPGVPSPAKSGRGSALPSPGPTRSNLTPPCRARCRDASAAAALPASGAAASDARPHACACSRSRTPAAR